MDKRIIVVLYCVSLLLTFTDCVETENRFVGMTPETKMWKLISLLARSSMKQTRKVKRSGDLVNTLRGIEAVIPTNLMENSGKRNRPSYFQSAAERMKTLRFNGPYKKLMLRHESRKPSERLASLPKKT